MSSRLTTDVAVDAAAILDASWKPDRRDRRSIDDQIIGIQAHLVRSLLRGVFGTWMFLDPGASRDGAEGDCVCLSLSSNTASAITLATPASLAASGGIFGVLTTSAKRGALAHVALFGALPPNTSGLAPLVGDAEFVRVNTTTSRCERVTSLSAGDYLVGSADALGNLTIQRSNPSAGGGGGGGSITEAQLRTAASALTAPLSFNGQRGVSLADPLNPTDLSNKRYIDNLGALIVDATPPTGATTTMQTIVLAPDTFYEIVCSVTCRDASNNFFSAYHSQKWFRGSAGGATNLQVNDPVQVTNITGVTANASQLVASGNNVLVKLTTATAVRYHADIYIRTIPLAHI